MILPNLAFLSIRITTFLYCLKKTALYFYRAKIISYLIR
nr:MAG TPA: hypothetical protein [Herelleviridae sp.]DAI67398.1 MAG TPA: hypothetical protein [Caudoviricetes sp.]